MILLVEDCAPLRELFTEVLIFAGFKVCAMDNAAEALAMVRQFPQSIELGIVDFSLPRMDGGELAESLWILLPDLQIILISGHGFEVVRGLSRPEKIQFLQKPCSVRQLQETVRELLANHEYLSNVRAIHGPPLA